VWTLKTLKPDDRRTAYAISRRLKRTDVPILSCTDHVPKLTCVCTESVLMYRNGPLSKNYVPKWYVPKVSCTDMDLPRCKTVLHIYVCRYTHVPTAWKAASMNSINNNFNFHNLCIGIYVYQVEELYSCRMHCRLCYNLLVCCLCLCQVLKWVSIISSLLPHLLNFSMLCIESVMFRNYESSSVPQWSYSLIA